jgi:hypothetical protein
MKNFSVDEIIILLGAGASCDAGIFNSAQMIGQIEKKLRDETWSRYKNLYQYIKSVHYQKQIFKGSEPNEIGFNIENLVSLLDIIIGISKSDIDTYTFVGSWEKDLSPFITKQREENLVSNFKEELIKELRGEWLCPKDWQKNSNYYSNLIRFRNSLSGFPLKIFTLNYDLCVEHNLKAEKVESGFDENDDWNFRRYDYNNPNDNTDYYLYKLHGSIDWERTSEEKLIKKIGDIKTEKLAIIFGINNKLQSYDPYLFYFYEFREHCLRAKMIICSGYSFMDEHINDLVKSVLKDSPDKKLVINVYETNKNEEQLKDEFVGKLKINKQQIIVFNKKAKDFFCSDLKIEKLATFFSDDTENLPEDF